MLVNDGLPAWAIESISGFSAGVASTLAVHPLDIIKTRLQINASARSQVGQSLRVARDVFVNEGGLRALYRGLSINLFANAVSWSCYFVSYSKYKTLLAEIRGDGGLGAVDYFLASAAGGVTVCIYTNPLWVIKSRMLSSAKGAPGAYDNMVQGFGVIVRNEGLRGLYRGFAPALVGCLHGGIQFMAFEQLKIWQSRRRDRHRGQGGFTNVEVLGMSAASKVFAGVVTYPYQTIRTRLQVHDSRSVRHVVRQLWRYEGPAGFYKGLGPNLARILPSTCVMFLVYENMKFYLQNE